MTRRLSRVCFMCGVCEGDGLSNAASSSRDQRDAIVPLAHGISAPVRAFRRRRFTLEYEIGLLFYPDRFAP
jgi:hypothetical protein